MDKIEEIVKEGIEAFVWDDGIIMVKDATNRITEDIATLIEDREKKAVEGFAKAIVERYFEKDQEFWGMTSSISAIDFEWFVENFITHPEQYLKETNK